MTSDRKKPGWAFWATVTLVVVLVGYPLSLGPVIWLASRGYLPMRVWESYCWPTSAFLTHVKLPQSLQGPVYHGVNGYIQLWLPPLKADPAP